MTRHEIRIQQIVKMAQEGQRVDMQELNESRATIARIQDFLNEKGVF